MLTGKVALVTGANRGIGRGIAESLAKAGAQVALNYPNADVAVEVEEAVDAIHQRGGECFAVKADVSRLVEINGMFAEVIERFGQIDVLVNNAGLDLGATKFLEVDEALYDRMMGVNLKGAYFCSQIAVKAMIRAGRGGKIINISSVQANHFIEDRSVYSATKGGLSSLTRQLALDLSPYKINVNAIAPGFIEVDRTIKGDERYDRAERAKRIPIGRVGFPHDVGELAVFLASPAAEYITGQVMTIDGGSTCRYAR
jgi:glucose 1-dehydrogenase/3-oxoacyl-[acyl-carrier protein] reductase